MSKTILELHAPDYACSNRGPCGCELCELLAEAKQLQAELATANAENKRLREAVEKWCEFAQNPCDTCDQYPCGGVCVVQNEYMECHKVHHKTLKEKTMSHGKIESCTKHNDGWIRWSEGDKCPLCQLVAENKTLKEFARPVIRIECWSILEQDGDDLQELAKKLNLIVPDVATQEDVDNELYDGYYEVGDEMYKFSDVLKE